jgi:hypothetical protein
MANLSKTTLLAGLEKLEHLQSLLHEFAGDPSDGRRKQLREEIPATYGAAQLVYRQVIADRAVVIRDRGHDKTFPNFFEAGWLSVSTVHAHEGLNELATATGKLRSTIENTDFDSPMQDPEGKTGHLSCPWCTRETEHDILAIANTREYETHGLSHTINHYLTVQCKGCRKISFCHDWSDTAEEDFDEKGRPYLPRHRTHYPEPTAIAEPFVDVDKIRRIEQLRTVDLDTKRLAQMLREMNASYKAESYMSCIFSIRAILDHVPPIFGFATFAQVTANYAGGRSFKDSIEHLERASRKIADSYLHAPIRRDEATPSKMQVEFRADVDVLLAECIRRLEAASRSDLDT